METPVVDFPIEEAVKVAESPEDDILASLTPQEKKIVSKVLPLIADKANRQAEANKAKQLQAVVDELRTSNQQMIEAELERIRNDAKPPDPQDLEKLLSQEYLEFKLQIREKKVLRDFVIRELPQAVESKLLKCIQTTVVPHLRELAQVEWNTGTTADKLQHILDIIPDTMDTMADMVAICLDPYNTDGITKQWVQAHVSSKRMIDILQAQMTAGRLRELFLGVSALLPR